MALRLKIAILMGFNGNVFVQKVLAKTYAAANNTAQ